MKLQPNFSWQKYEGQPEQQREQFQYQLQSQHIQVANSVNTTIDDESYWTRERMTAFTWIDGSAIWTKTITGTIVAGVSTTSSYPHGITGIAKVVGIDGFAQDTIPFGSTGIPIPYVNAIVASLNIGIYINATNVNLTTNSAGFNGYSFSVTIYYTKTR